jgi:penicillin V acylase-like amidase (Ntn superfamily)
MKRITISISTILLLVLITFLHFNNASACSRVVYEGPNNTIITARSMDWKFDLKSNLWIFPAGMQREGVAGPNSIKWKSKYGSVVASAYEIASSDGMNEKGLVANVLWLSEAEYPVRDLSKPGLTVAAWVQYALDNFATVNEVVEFFKDDKVDIISAETPDLKGSATLHLCLSDASGDNALFEYVKGKLVIYHNKSYVVITNSPTYDKQLALTEYWEQIGGTVMLPGTNKAEDRFVRASFYIKACEQTDNIRIALASVFGVIRNVSVPYGITDPDPGKPNISATRWRAVADHKNKVYYFETYDSPSVLWVDLKEADLKEGAHVKKLTLTTGEIYGGSAVKYFTNAEPFKFAGIDK